MHKITLSRSSWQVIWDQWCRNGTMETTLWQWLWDHHGCTVDCISKDSIELKFKSSVRAIEFVLRYS